MLYTDIKKYTRFGHYRIDVDLDYFERCIQRYIDMGLILNPDFQRGHVWSKKQQISFVEYVLRGGSGAKRIMFNCVGWGSGVGYGNGNFVLVDGLQRVTAISKFLSAELAVFDGNYIDDIVMESGELGRWLRSDSLSFEFLINNLETREEVLRWYLELNSGGVIHTKEELDKVRKLLGREVSDG